MEKEGSLSNLFLVSSVVGVLRPHCRRRLDMGRMLGRREGIFLQGQISGDVEDDAVAGLLLGDALETLTTSLSNNSN